MCDAQGAIEMRMWAALDAAEEVGRREGPQKENASEKPELGSTEQGEASDKLVPVLAAPLPYQAECLNFLARLHEPCTLTIMQSHTSPVRCHVAFPPAVASIRKIFWV